MKKKQLQQLSAQASLAVMAVLAIVIIFIAMVVSQISYNQYRDQARAINEGKSFMLADSALELALLSLYRDSAYAGGTLTLPEGSTTVAVANLSGNQKRVTSVSSNYNVRIEVVTTTEVNPQGKPFENYAAFGADDIFVQNNNVEVVGDIWLNDNLTMQNNGLVRGNVYAGGAGSSSNSNLSHTSKILDNPNTPEIEGNLTAIDNIIISGGTVQGTAKSKKSVSVSGGGTVGASVVDTNLVITQKPVPNFDFTTYKAQAQAEGTYFTSPAQFTNYLSASGNTISGNVFFIDSNSSMTLNSTTAYNITGAIVTRGPFNIRPRANYTQLPAAGLPAVVTENTLRVDNLNACDCKVSIQGVIFAKQSIILDHPNYTGGTYGILVDGAAWAGDDVTVRNRTQLIINPSVLAAVTGFNFGAASTTNNEVKVINWNIE